MPTVPLYDMQGSEVGEVSLADQVFGLEPDEGLIHQVVVAVLAGQRQGTANAKTRGQVSGSTRKLWRQKGTGRARVGNRRPPHWSGGGVAMGPSPRSYRQRLPRAEKLAGLRSALSAQVRDGLLKVLDRLELPEVKTRQLKGVLDALEVAGRSLLVTGEADAIVWRCGRNIAGLTIRPAADLNALDVATARRIVMTKDAVEMLEARLS